MIEKLRRIVESLGYPFFFGTRDEVYAYINSVRTVVACYRQGGGGSQQFFVFKFKGDKPQRMYEEVMREIKRQFTVGVQRVFFYDDVLEARFPLMAKTYTEGGARPTPPVVNDYMYFEAAEANSTVSLTSMLETAPNLEYSTDGETWHEWENTYNPESMFGPAYVFDIITLSNVGDRIYLRGNNPAGLGSSEYVFSVFFLTGKLNSGGLLTSLLDKTLETTNIPDFCFSDLFAGEVSPNVLQSFPDTSNIETIGNYGMVGCFGGISSATPPDFSNVIEVGAYGLAFAFFSCINLTKAADMPLLQKVGENGLNEMYRNCISLVTAGNLGTNMQLGENCLRSMYVSCNAILESGGQLTFSFNQLPTAYGSSTLADVAAVKDEMTYFE